MNLKKSETAAAVNALLPLSPPPIMPLSGSDYSISSHMPRLM